jgi:hypothetical protein
MPAYKPPGYIFAMGWSDRMNDLPCREFRKQAHAFAYERGRHMAVLYLTEAKRDGGTINRALNYSTTYKLMSKALKKLIRAENKFMQPPKRKSALEGLVPRG